MPKASVLQSSFNSGEVSPLYYGQSENPRYKKGLKVGLNLIPTLQGPVIRRPATKFCAQVKDSTKPPFLLKFKFNESQAYILEFGDQYIRFYTNNGQMITVGSSFKLKGIPSFFQNYFDTVRGNIGWFYATRATAVIGDNEQALSTTTSIPGGSILELQSPYLYSDLPLLRIAQNEDTLYIAHPNYPLFKLQRQGQTYWKLTPVVLRDGPYFELNTYAIPGDFSNVNLQNDTSGNVQTVGVAISGAIADPGGSGQIQITTASAHNLFSGQNVYIEGVVGTTEANNWDPLILPGATFAYWTIQVTSATTYLLIGSTFVNAYSAGGTSFPALFALSAAAVKNVTMVPDTGRSIGIIIGGFRYSGYLAAIGPKNASKWLVSWQPDIAIGQVPTVGSVTAWQLGVYSPGTGFPRCLTFHQNRLVLGGPGGSPQEVDGSVTGDYENFAASDKATLVVKDSSAYSEILSSTESNVLQWMSSAAQGLLSASADSEWVITPSQAGGALTATDFEAQRASFFGSSPAAPVQIGNATLYIQRAFRKIREMNYTFQAGTFRSIDLTELSENITVPSVSQLEVTKETQPLIWALRSDGTIVSMIYNRDDLSLIAGWTRHILGGRSDTAGSPPVVTSIAAIPSPDISFDQLWMVVKRYHLGSTVYYIEYMTKIFDDGIAQEDAVQGDCAGTFFNPANITAVVLIPSSATLITCSGSTPFTGLANGDLVRLENMVGLNITTQDLNGNVSVAHPLDGFVGKVFGVLNTVVGPVTTTSFQLLDPQGIPVTFPAGPDLPTPWVSGGTVAKLVSTISGATWLAGETVGCLVDGGIHPDVAIDITGQFTLINPGTKIQFGYRFPSQAQLLRADAGSPLGTAMGTTRRTTRLAVQMHRTGDLSLGTTFNNLIPVEFLQADVDDTDSAVPLFSGMIREGLESAYDFDSQPCLQMSSMLPGCIQSVTSFMEEQDV